jgi:putative peptidoglycan lipid II flippase
MHPHLAELSNRGEWQLLRRRIGILLLVAGGVALLVALLIAGLSRPLISLLFERGAFDAAAVQVTTQFLAIYALGLPIYVLTDLATRALVACYDTLSAMLTNIGQLLLRILLLTLTIGPYGPIAVPMVHVLSSAVETLILLLVLRMRTRP